MPGPRRGTAKAKRPRTPALGPSERIRRARVELMLRHPFFGNLALYLTPTERPGSKLGTDGRRFFYDPEALGELSDAELVFVLAHVVLHLALDHFGRRGGRDPRRWDLAADYAVNAILLAPKPTGEGMSGPAGAAYRRELVGLSAEEIFARLEPKAARPRGGLDQHPLSEGASGAGQDAPGEGADGSRTSSEGAEGQGSTGGQRSASEAGEPDAQGVPSAEDGPEEDAREAGEPGPRGGRRRARASSQPRPAEPELGEFFDRAAWKRRTITQATAARLRGTLPASMERPLGELLEPACPWTELLAQFVHAQFRADYRLLPPNRRFVAQGIYLPSIRGEHLEMVVAIDTSGSISPALLQRFASELRGILLSLPSYTVHVLACDAAIGLERTFEPEDDLELPRMVGGGGTDFRPVFTRVDEAGWRIDLLLYMTDALGTFPEGEPEYPVLWLLPEGEHAGRVPFGRTLTVALDDRPAT